MFSNGNFPFVNKSVFCLKALFLLTKVLNFFFQEDTLANVDEVNIDFDCSKIDNGICSRRIDNSYKVTIVP